MRAWVITFIQIHLFLLFWCFAAISQTDSVIVQGDNINYLRFQAEDFSQLYSSETNESRWEFFTSPTGDGIQSVGSLSDGSFNGPNADKAVYKLEIKDPAAGTEVYRLYIRAKENAQGNPTLNYFISSSIGVPSGVLPPVGVSSPTFKWIDTGRDYEIPAGIQSFILFPRDEDLQIDQIILWKYDLSGGGSPPSEMDIDMMASSSSEVVIQDPDGLAGYGIPEGNNGVGNLSINTTESTGGDAIQERSALNFDSDKGYFPYSGNFYFEMIADQMPGMINLVFAPLIIGCYSTVTDINITAGFRWYSPDAGAFESGDDLEATLHFLNAGNMIVGSTSLLGPGTVNLNDAGRYRLISQSGINPPNAAVQKVVLEINFTSSQGRSVYIDDIVLQLEGPSVQVPEPSFGNGNDLGEETISPIIFTNTTTNTIDETPKEDDVVYFWDYGDGTSGFTTLDADHEFQRAGVFSVCLTATNCINCETGGECRTSSTFCEEVTVTGGVLPVELTSFTATAEGRDVRLDWATATEVNNDYFQVEHSRDGAAFSTLARVPGAGDSKTPLTYRYLHERAPAGLNYYRLKQVDYGGSFEYSKVVTAVVGSTGALLIYPNPARQEVQVQSDLKAPLRYTLYDSFGRLLRQGTVAPQGAIDLAGLPGGTYHLRLENEDGEILARERVLRIE